MATGTYNITIEKGITFDVSISLKDNNNAAINVTNYTFKAEIRRKAETGLEKAFTVAKTNASGGVIELSMSKTDTQALPKGKLIYDLVANTGSSNKIIRIITGTVTVVESVTDTSNL
jgi:hypothetical protein